MHIFALSQSYIVGGVIKRGNSIWDENYFLYKLIARTLDFVLSKL